MHEPEAQRGQEIVTLQKADITDNVMSVRKSEADMAPLYKVSPATITRTVAEVRLKQKHALA